VEVSAPRTFTARQLWLENNGMAAALAGARTELGEANEQIHRLKQENERLLAELRGKREAMARVLDAYAITHPVPDAPGCTVVGANLVLALPEGVSLGVAVRQALHHAKGGKL
jgi:hypothetical protein